jgi:hypothetical protein
MQNSGLQKGATIMKGLQHSGSMFFLAGLLVLLATPGLALMTDQINFQGELTDASGNPVADDTYAITFALYLTPSATIPLWIEPTVPVAVVNGVFNVKLPHDPGAAPFPPGLFDNELYFGVQVGTDPEMSPRQVLTAVPFAFKAADAEMLGGRIPDEFADAWHSHDFSELSGMVDDGQVPNTISIDHAAHATDADYAGDADNLDGRDSSTFADITHGHDFGDLSGIVNDAQVPNNITINYAASAGSAAQAVNADTVDGQHAAAFMGVGTDLWVDADGDNMSGRLEVATNIIGSGWGESIKGILNTSENGAGVYGISGGTDSYGVAGRATGANGAGIFGEVTGTYGRGVYGLAHHDGGVGVYGHNEYRDNFGYVGYRDAGIYGKNNANGNDGRIGSFWEGVRGYSPTQRGILGVSDSGEGVRGTHQNSGNTGVLGHSLYGIFAQSALAGVYAECTNGNVGYIGGIGAAVYGEASSPSYHAGWFDGKVMVEGTTTTEVLVITGGADLSENFDVSPLDRDILPGMVVSIDPARPGDLMVSQQAYDRKVAGIISGAGDVQPGMRMGQQGTRADGEYPVALTGRVYCWADASQGAIQPGDLLTTSSTPGHAMRVGDHTQAAGTTIGKAMTSLDEGTGLVLVLVSLQ